MSRATIKARLDAEVKTWTDQVSDDVLTDAAAAVYRRPTKVDRSYDIPYVAGYSIDGRTVFIDRHMPKSMRVRGSAFDIDVFLVLHEMVEKSLLAVGAACPLASAANSFPRPGTETSRGHWRSRAGNKRNAEMKLTIMLATALALGSASGAAFAASDKANANAPGQDRVCLVTFSKAGTSANADVTSAKILPRKAAEAQASDTMKIYEYGAQGELTQAACDCLNNPSTRATCDQPVRPAG